MIRLAFELLQIFATRVDQRFDQLINGDNSDEFPISLWPILSLVLVIFLLLCLGPNVVGFGLSIIESILWPS